MQYSYTYMLNRGRAQITLAELDNAGSNSARRIAGGWYLASFIIGALPANHFKNTREQLCYGRVDATTDCKN